jgi:nucleotide-binding universal stress UspA family protein
MVKADRGVAMFNRIIVPVDGSTASWRAAAVGDRLAVACDADFEVLHVEPALDDRQREQLAGRIATTAWTGPAPTLTFVPERFDVPEAIADHLAGVNGGMVVMASTGRGRSEAVLGSVTAEVLTLTYGPIIVVGPEVEVEGSLAGTSLCVTVDGSRFSETALGLAGAWGIAMGLRPWVIGVAEPGGQWSSDVLESNHVALLARRLQARTGRDTEFEMLHDRRPARAITDFARTLGTRFIVTSTHGRSGLARLAMGSVAAGIVRHAPCPVVLMRPPELAAPKRTEYTVASVI